LARRQTFELGLMNDLHNLVFFLFAQLVCRCRALRVRALYNAPQCQDSKIKFLVNPPLVI
jgi:hypothetical protein